VESLIFLRLLVTALLETLPSESSSESTNDEALELERLRLWIVRGGVGSEASEAVDEERFRREGADGTTTGGESSTARLDIAIEIRS
jgi:hypothetical protein